MLEAENDIIARARLGDAQAFGLLYDHYAQPIYRFIAVKVSVRQEAEDLLHEVFLAAWQKLPGYASYGFPFSSWLYRIARNRVIDHYRTHRAHSSFDDERAPSLEDQALLIDERHGDAVDMKIDLAMVQGAMKELSPDQQDVLIFKFVEDMDVPEIAHLMNKKEGTVRIIQHRAILQLKKILAKQKLR